MRGKLLNTTTESIEAVEQEGIVTKITDNVITVSLKANSNCEGCKAKAACGVSESNLKEIEIDNTNQPLCLNEKVQVLLRKDLGLKAVFWAYIFPFVLMISTLFITIIFMPEWLAGVISLVILVPYYMLLYVLKNDFKKAFKVSILKYN